MMDDIKSLFDPAMKDAEYIREVAEAKRALELWTMERSFQEAFKKDADNALQEYGLSIDAESVRILTDRDEAMKFAQMPQEKIPRPVRRYRAFMREKRDDRDRLAHIGCAPVQSEFRAWRVRQVNRCWTEFGIRNRSLIHAPMMFELGLGCSMGCPFCGIAAKKLEKVCRYDEENAMLWRSILSYVKETIGDAAAHGTCYYASEPFDNPDYEKFADDFYEILGEVPQITTAASMRNPERTKGYLAAVLEKERRVHRFSVLSLDILHKIHDYFTPEELLYVELLPQFAETPYSKFAKVGRARDLKDGSVEKDAGSTIACISGFVVNMAERTVRLLTPCAASDERPTGEYIIAKESFSDFDDFKRVMTGMIGRHMLREFPRDMELCLRPSISYEPTEEGINFYRREDFKLKFSEGDDLSAAFYHRVLAALKNGGNAYDIAEKLMEEYDDFPAHVFFLLRKFEKAGLFLEPYEM